jgi:glycosyltransferase involved in cell wall biosynthesis
MSAKPRTLFVSATEYELPLSQPLARKWDAVAGELELRIVGRGSSDGDPRLRLVDARGARFFAALPRVVASELRRFRPEAVVTQSPFEAVACLPALRAVRPRPALIVELHGDWQMAPRAYGSRARRLVAPLTDKAAVLALRRADGVRAVGSFTSELAKRATGRQPTAVFTTYSDLHSFQQRPVQPLPEQPTVAWVGVLQRYKDPETFARAWRLLAERLPDARLTMVGDGPLRNVAEGLSNEYPDRVRVAARVSQSEVSEILDDSTLLSLPSLSEGLPRVAIEAFTRGRPVVGSAAGGIPDIVVPERNGMLVPPRSPELLAAALERVLADRELAGRLGRAAQEDAGRFSSSPEGFARSVRQLVDTVLEGRG